MNTLARAAIERDKALENDGVESHETDESQRLLANQSPMARGVRSPSVKQKVSFDAMGSECGSSPR